MKLGKLIQCMSVVTVLALIYINMQMQIFDLAYQGKSKEKKIMDLSETNGIVTYNILNLKSANNLGIKLLTEESELKFGDNSRIIQLVTAETLNEPQTVPSSVNSRKENPILSFLSLRTEAEARTTEKKNVSTPW